jgi:ferric-dicitrate binding protein FerR (iron transport regulator)
MNEISDKLFEKFLSGKRITDNEFLLLESILDDTDKKKEVFQWLENKWQHSEPEKVNLQFAEIRKQIRNKSTKQRLKKVVLILSKAAAILFIPLFVTSLYFYVNRTDTNKFLTLTTQKGEQTSVILPDGSKVWLNVDTKLSYPVNYGVKSRNVNLEGEAYFEVMKNKELPFEVSSDGITTKALGTSFVISSYPESSAIRSSLIKGSVEVSYKNGSEVLKPGQQLVYKKDKSSIIVQQFSEDDELAWKNEQLIFRLTPFDQVIEELEKWYGVDFDYNPALFRNETFTAKFERSETLEHVLQVMSSAGGFKYRVEGKTVKIIK